MKPLLLLLAFGAFARSQEDVASAAATPSLDDESGEDCLGGDAFLSEPATEETKVAVNEGERAFSVNLVKDIFAGLNETGVRENIFVSPASIYQTLTLAYMGAKGETEKELAAVMGLSDVSRPEVIKNYLYERAFQTIRDADPDLGYELAHANKFYFDRSLALNKCLKVVLQDELEAVDFGNAKKTRNVINGWVERKTHKKIKDLLPEGAIDGNSKVALVNAAYFKGGWASKFDAEETFKGNFYVRRDKISPAKFMKQKGKFNYYTSEELRAHVLELPYVGDEVSMIVILPPFETDSLHETVSRLTPDAMRGVMSEVKSGFYTVDDLTVTMPKFSVEQRFELVETLQHLGVESLFDPARADLGGFLGAKSEDSVNLQNAVHKSYIEVKEEGTEAAAATALFGFRSARPLFHTEFKMDHPFLYMIYDKPSDTILFFGVFQDPKL